MARRAKTGLFLKSACSSLFLVATASGVLAQALDTAPTSNTPVTTNTPGASESPAAAQNTGVQEAAVARSQIFAIDRDALFSQSLYGKRILADLEQERARLASEAREVEAALAEEEKQLTTQRDTLPADEFRTLADAFDAKVQALRQETPAREKQFTQRFEQERNAFFEKVGPVLGQLVRDLGGIMIVDRRAILLTTQNIDITAASIDRIDAVLGDGAQPSSSATETPPTAAAEQN